MSEDIEAVDRVSIELSTKILPQRWHGWRGVPIGSLAWMETLMSTLLTNKGAIVYSYSMHRDKEEWYEEKPLFLSVVIPFLKEQDKNTCVSFAPGLINPW
jgi:hypothetical protein